MRALVVHLLAASVCLSLAACMTVPANTAVQLATLDPLHMAPADIRVVAVFPEGIRLKPGDVVMDIGWKGSDGSHEVKRHFALDLVTGNAVAPRLGRMLRPQERVYQLTLSARDAESFEAMQAEVQRAENAGEKGSGSLSVGFAGGCTADPAIRRGPVMTSVLLRPDATSDYLPIFSDLDLMDVLRKSGLSEVPVCAEASARPATAGDWPSEFQ